MSHPLSHNGSVKEAGEFNPDHVCALFILVCQKWGDKKYSKSSK